MVYTVCVCVCVCVCILENSKMQTHYVERQENQRKLPVYLNFLYMEEEEREVYRHKISKPTNTDNNQVRYLF
jgi:hypothetical protein